MYIKCLCRMPVAPQYSHPNSYNPAISRSLISFNISTTTQPPNSPILFTNIVTNESAQRAIEGASNNNSNNSSHQTISTERRLRSSGPPLGISLESVVRDAVTPEQRRNEILRIVTGDSDEALSNYYVGTNAEMLQVHRLLSFLVHPDKQTSNEWKERATRAQQSKS